MVLKIIRLYLLLFTLLFHGIALAVTAEQAMPIYVANQNPFVQVYGLPKAEPGTITPKGRLEAGFLYFVSNNAISADVSNGESIVWDGETAQYNLKFRYGLAERLELGLDIPYIQHSGGWLDSIIRNYHDLAGFPNDRQEQFEKDQIDYEVADNGTIRYALKEQASGLGDVRVSAAVPLLDPTVRAKRHLAIRSILKLPTGEADELLGSGGTDVSLGLAYTDYRLLSGINTVLSAYGGGIFIGESDVLSEKQNRFAGYGGVSLDWFVLHYLELKLQLDFHSAFYDSELKQLGTSIQLLAGGTAHLPGELMLDLGISEQLVTDATPDVGLYLFLSRLF